MLKALGLKSSSPSPTPQTSNSKLETSLAVLDDAISLEDGLRAMDLVMDDRPQEAEKVLQEGKDTTYTKLARGVTHFIEATLSFEAEAIKKAVDSLYEAEQSSQRDRTKAQKNSIQTSWKYPPGTEYSITLAESHLLGAISLFLSESMVDSVKAIYKLRKAYQVLDEVNKVINGGGKPQQTLSRKSSQLSQATALSEKSQSLSKLDGSSTPGSYASSSSTKEIDLSAEQEMTSRAKRVYLARAQRVQRSSNPSQETLSESADADYQASISGSETSVSDGAKAAGYQTVDEFIQSGVDALFGLLQLVISIIPPGFGKVLSIVGFRGDRDEGLKMMWKATKHRNIHGAVAVLALLQYYDGPSQFADIELPDTLASGSDSDSGSERKLTPAEEFAHIKHKLERSLEATRKHYSTGALWQLQEGRMAAAKGNLKRAVEIMDDDSNGPIAMKQVEGLMLFDKTIMIVILHGYERAAQNFIELIKLNSWSHAFYSYMSAACQIEIYRQNVGIDDSKATEAKKAAKECLEKMPSLLKKKGFMAKSMPFDVFALRKLNQWKDIAAKQNLDLVDAVGTSPIHEVAYFWNGFSRMPKEQLEESLQSLGYSAGQGAPDGYGSGPTSSFQPPLKEVEDEQVTRCLLQSIILRTMDRKQEGLDLLEKYVLPKIWTPQPTSSKGTLKSGLPKVHYNKSHRDPYLGPSAIYERAIFEWQINGIESKQKVEDYLDLATHWADDYELSTRVGMRIKSATDRLELM